MEEDSYHNTIHVWKLTQDIQTNKSQFIHWFIPFHDNIGGINIIQTDRQVIHGITVQAILHPTLSSIYYNYPLSIITIYYLAGQNKI